MPELPVITTLGQSAFIHSLMVVGFVGISVLLILVILIQRPQGGGLSGAFGAGAGSGQTAFGAKTGDALTIATVFMFVLFLLGAIGLGFMARPDVAADQQPAITSTTLPADATQEQGGADTSDDSGATEGAVVPVAPAPEPIDGAPADDTPTPTGDTPTPPADDAGAGTPTTDDPQSDAPSDGG